MADKIKLVRNDTGPQIKLTLTNQETGTPVNLTGGTVTMHFRRVGETVVLFSRAAYINPSTAANGEAILGWATGALSLEAGDYEGEIEVVRSTGERETVYDVLKFKLREDFA